jgi:hypothetical protein
MRKIGYFSIILLLTIQFMNAQNNWEKININNWGVILLPNSMEIQSGIYKKNMDKAKQEFSVNAERIVFQQKGVNEGKNLNTYARVIIRTDFGKETLPNLNTEVITSADVADINEMYKSQNSQATNNPKFPYKIIKWNNVKIISLNGQKCINYSYIRQMGTNPQTLSEVYIFWKGKNQHSLIIEYRINDAIKWKQDLSKCLNSFSFKKQLQ